MCVCAAPQVLGTGSEGDWLTDLKIGSLAAFVMDEPLLQYIDHTTDCQSRSAGLGWAWC